MYWLCVEQILKQLVLVKGPKVSTGRLPLYLGEAAEDAASPADSDSSLPSAGADSSHPHQET